MREKEIHNTHLSTPLCNHPDHRGLMRKTDTKSEKAKLVCEDAVRIFFTEKEKVAVKSTSVEPFNRVSQQFFSMFAANADINYPIDSHLCLFAV